MSMTSNPAQYLSSVDSLLDNFDNLEGAPTAIQIATTRMRDEECFAFAKLIDVYVRAKAGNLLSIPKL